MTAFCAAVPLANASQLPLLRLYTAAAHESDSTNSFGAEVAKSRHSGLSAEVDYSRPLGGECCRLYSLLTEVAHALHT